MTFRLEKKSSNHALVKFHILNAGGDIVGSINVPPREERDLLKCWRDSAPAAGAKSALATAFKKEAAARR
jgi:hypothetical protein